jgi:hypothetical protein
MHVEIRSKMNNTINIHGVSFNDSPDGLYQTNGTHLISDQYTTGERRIDLGIGQVTFQKLFNIKYQGKLILSWPCTRQIAEDYLASVSEDVRAHAQLVHVDASGKELLLG